jgi:hypothetical protein
MASRKNQGEKRKIGKKKRLLELKYMFVQDTPTKDGGAAERI